MGYGETTITPVEIRHAELPRRALGYSRTATDQLLDRIVGSYEAAWRGRADLEDKVERLEAELVRFRELERLLRDTMMSAERASEDLRSQARREHDLLLQQARLQAREIVAGAEGERERLRVEVRRLESLRGELRAGYRAFLQAALERLDLELDEPDKIEDTGELALPGHAA
jgi:cell division initiation protein